ncbi:L,D-transpeptidase [Bosea sp. (in: a-proteobacteria)]|uniref:L,D-transpeptidase n=1 Tax=Bosea sp. (in: a-proteobacteria) TaxID=1871050 RepID=UPI0035636D12
MRRMFGLMAVIFLSWASVGSAQAGVDVRVDIAAQRIQVTTTDGEAYNWAISSGRKGFRSPNGVYRPTRLEKNWYSRKYGGAMPNAVFFRGGYAIHGTTAVGALGRPASHGCIRLHPTNAAKLFALVKKHGASQTRIALNGAANDGLSQFAKVSGGTKSKIAKAKAKERAAIAQQRKAPNWDAARGEILLRPALPAGAFGYQPYMSSGPRWR